MKNIEDIIESLYENRGSLVPIIGDEMFVYEKNGMEIPLQHYIVDHFRNRILFDEEGDDKKVFGNKDNLLEEMKKQGYYGMTLLYKHFIPQLTRENGFKEAIADFYKNNHEQIHLKRIVKEFLLKSNYPLVITTSPFNIIERDLNYQNSIFYDTEVGCDEEITESIHCVYHLFGPRQKEKNAYNITSLINGNFVTNEYELLEFLHAINKTPHSALTKYLKEKFLLVLGCCLPNWFFRFLLYPIHNSGDVFLVNSEVTSEKLDYYLYCVGYNKSCYIEQILQELKEKIDLEVEESYENAVFLSFASEDKEPASKLKELLEEEFGIKVWMYSDEIISGSWQKQIEDSFNKSKYFVPLITENYLNKLDNPNSGLKECISKFGLQRIIREDDYGNYGFVQPILMDGTIMNNELVTPDSMNKWTQSPYCPNLKVILQNSRQIHTYKNGNNLLSLADRLDTNGYKVFEKLLKSK